MSHVSTTSFEIHVAHVGHFFGKKEAARMSLSEKNGAAFQYHNITWYKLLSLSPCYKL